MSDKMIEGVVGRPLTGQPALAVPATPLRVDGPTGFDQAQGFDIGFAVHPTLLSAIWAQVKRTVRTWRYARSIGADPTHWWGVYEAGTEICLASTGPLPGAEDRARRIDAALTLRIET